MIVNCAAYSKGEKLADIGTPEIGDYVKRPECFVWVALKDPEDAELEAMGRQFVLHPLAVEDARHGHQRPKIEEYGDSLFAVLHIPELTADGDIHIAEVSLFVGPNYVLSVRRNASV